MKRLLVTDAGTSASINLVRSLRAGVPDLFVAGAHDDRFVLAMAPADRRYLLPPPDHPGYGPALCRAVAEARVDLVIPTSDRSVLAVSRLAATLPCRTFLPAPDVVALCQDKLETARRLGARGVAAPETRPVSGVDGLEADFAAFAGRAPLWCRPRHGTCARGAAPVRSAEEARRWILLWRDMRGVPPETFTLSEYLPGRDFLCQSLWQDGALVLVNTFERLSYFGVDNIPSGITSLSSLAKTVVDDRLVDLVRRAVLAVAPGASGAFSVDCREDAGGAPRVTEINAGRLLMAMTAFDAVGKHGMALTYARLGWGEPVELREVYDGVADHYLVRDLDTAPGLFHADDLFEGITRIEG